MPWCLPTIWIGQFWTASSGRCSSSSSASSPRNQNFSNFPNSPKFEFYILHKVNESLGNFAFLHNGPLTRVGGVKSTWEFLQTTGERQRFRNSNHIFKSNLAIGVHLRRPRGLHSLSSPSLDYQPSLSRTSNALCVCFKQRQNGDKVTRNGSFTRVYVSL